MKLPLSGSGVVVEVASIPAWLQPGRATIVPRGQIECRRT